MLPKYAMQSVADRSAHERNQLVFLSSHQEWNHNRIIASELAVLSHVLFRRSLERVDSKLQAFWKQIEKGHAFTLPFIGWHLQNREYCKDQPITISRMLCPTRMNLVLGIYHSLSTLVDISFRRIQLKPSLRGWLGTPSGGEKSG